MVPDSNPTSCSATTSPHKSVGETRLWEVSSVRNRYLTGAPLHGDDWIRHSSRTSNTFSACDYATTCISRTTCGWSTQTPFQIADPLGCRPLHHLHLMILRREEGDLGATTDRPSPVRAEGVGLPPTKDRDHHAHVVTLRVEGEVRNVDGADNAAL